MKHKVKKSPVPAQREEESRIARMQAHLDSLRNSLLEVRPGESAPPLPDALRRLVDEVWPEAR